MEKKKILIVDDDFGTRELIESIFLDDEDRFEILKAIDAHTGLSLLEQDPGLIIVDIMMPKIDGFEFIRKVRNLGPKKDVPIMVLTAKHQEEDLQEAIHAGADEFMTKPFDIEVLKKSIETRLFHPELLPEDDEFFRHPSRMHYVKGKKR